MMLLTGSLPVLLSAIAFVGHVQRVVSAAIPADNHPHPTNNQADECPIAHTNQGTYRGTHLNDDVSAFLGVPYAQPPVDDLRFRPAVPINPDECQLDQPVDASEFGPVCWQFHYKTVMLNNTMETTPQSEDCLNANVFVPRASRAEGELLPVLLWSYGGAFSEGGGSVPVFNPKNLVASQSDIIVVTFNYRVNVFGFPNSPALPPDQQNLGLRDHRAALEWVHSNIAAFGGDPEKITFGGQSAGADAVAAGAYAYPDDPIARAYLFESGNPDLAIAGGDPSEEFNRIAGIVGCRNTTDSAAELECMKGVPAADLRGAISNETWNTFGVPMGGNPFADNYTLFTAEEFVKRGEAGRFARLPVFLGMNDNEGDSIVNWSPKCGINHTLADEITLAGFECRISAEATYRSKYAVPIWRYRYFGRFAADTFFPWLGSFHISEIPFVLGSYTDLQPSRPVSDNERAAAKMLQDAVGTFVREPSRGLSEKLGWPEYDPDNTTVIELFHNNEPKIELGDPRKYNSGCANHPTLPWLEIANPPPTC